MNATTNTPFARIEQRYNNTKPYRGWSTDVRPWGNRRRQNEIIHKISNDTYAARLYNTDVVTVHRDGRVQINIAYGSQTTNKFTEQALRDLRLPGLPLRREGKVWLLLNGDYHPAWRHPVPLVPDTQTLGGYRVDMTRRQYAREVPDTLARKPLLDGIKTLRNAMRPLCTLADGKFTGETLLALWETPMPDWFHVNDQPPYDTLEYIGTHADAFDTQQLMTVLLHLLVDHRGFYPALQNQHSWAQDPERVCFLNEAMLTQLKDEILNRVQKYWRCENRTVEELGAPHKRVILIVK